MIEGKHFKNAYVTRDIVKWVDAFRASAPIEQLITFEGVTEVMTPAGPASHTNKVAFFWLGGIQYQFIQPISGSIDIFRNALPADDGLRLTHTCMRVDDWELFRARAAAHPCSILFENAGAAARFLYLDTRAIFGHCIEYNWMNDESWKQMGGR